MAQWVKKKGGFLASVNKGITNLLVGNPAAAVDWHPRRLIGPLNTNWNATSVLSVC
jgi:hypothetical protein